MENRLAVLVDASCLIYRAFYVFKNIKSPAGNPVGALYGFCSSLIDLIKDHKNDFFCVAMDSGRQTFRSEIYKDYKAHRAPMPDELRSQISLIDDACSAFGMPVVKKTGFEADDLLATLAHKFSLKNITSKIVGVDKDLLQLINDKIYIHNPSKSIDIHSNDVFDKYGIYPSQMRSFQAIVGDASDNIPGIKGIGSVGASKLLQKYNDLKNIYNNIDAILLQTVEKGIAVVHNDEVAKSFTQFFSKNFGS